MTDWDSLGQELKRACPEMRVCRNEPMSRRTSFRVGGPAALMAFPRTKGEARAAVATARGFGATPFFLGNGTNLLVSDGGYDGLVVRYSEAARPEMRDGLLTAGSAALLSEASNAAAKLGLTGLEWAYGIPGAVGGAVVMNAGAYGGEMAQVLSSVTVLNEDGAVETLPAKDCGLAYRRSAFSDGRRLILEAAFRLEPGEPADIWAKMDDLMERRKAKQPLGYPSAGSTFKRPAPLPDGTPVYAAALIERCGCKGLRIGGAQVSEKHAGFIVNTGGATCADILALIGEVRRRVLEQTGVELELEVRTLGV